jgi:predicted FMN-binding regulatory protein PaiB
MTAPANCQHIVTQRIFVFQIQGKCLISGNPTNTRQQNLGKDLGKNSKSQTVC